MMSRRANVAKANRTVEEIIEIADSLGGGQQVEGLGRLEWARLASLCSVALPCEHELRLRPLLVWPPNGLLVSKAHGVLMMGTSLMAPNYFRPAVAAEVRDLCGKKTTRKAFDEFMATLRIQLVVARNRMRHPPSVWHTFEDAWASGLVWQLFQKFVRLTPPEDIAAMRDVLNRAMAKWINEITDEEYLGWAIESRGYLTERRDELRMLAG